ncbi:PHYHD1 [Branchiostoma lanceolatum]|uniref:PHYHD1 protein n=1 Tax=Branchiostoma lanceolatum TaxID=7740 RepID=A0A8K0ENW5_BRALA|nr:PHYHD1 [Branchiostoma lanceolatum]
MSSALQWPPLQGPEQWLLQQDTEKWAEQFRRDGYLVVHNLIGMEEVKLYRDERKRPNVENICQIMWPSTYVQNLDRGPIHARAEAIARLLLGEDMAFDFDMLIYKAPQTNTCTPWHQDEAYWLDMPDKRAVSCWVALDDAAVDNGCMWFVAGSHQQQIRPHRPVKEGVHVLMTDHCSEEEGKPMAIPAGSCTLHHGRTLHYTRGNTTDRERRAYIVNYRPADMVRWEREHKFDHGKKGIRKVLELNKKEAS